MNLFVHKQYKSGNAAVFTFIINISIWFRASLATLTSVFKVDKKIFIKDKANFIFSTKEIIPK